MLGCQVARPTTWDTAIDKGTLTLPAEVTRDAPGHHFRFGLLSSDGHRWFGTLKSTDWSGLVTGRVGESSYQRIYQIGSPVEELGILVANERWLIFSWAKDATWGEWRLFAWDAQNNQLLELSHNQPGDTIPGWLILPALSNDKIAWVQGGLTTTSPESNQTFHSTLHLYDLSARVDHVLPTMRAIYPVVFWGNKLLWMEWEQFSLQSPENRRAKIAMADALTGELEPPPAPLIAHQQESAYLAASPTLLAWTDTHTLWIWHPGDAEAQAVYRQPEPTNSHAIQFLTIAGPLIAWTPPSPPPMIFDTRSGSATQLNGWAAGLENNRVLIATFATTTTTKPGSTDPLLGIPVPGPSDIPHIVDLSALPPLPACQRNKGSI